MIRGTSAVLMLVLALYGCRAAAADEGDPKLPPAIYPPLLRHVLSVEAFIPQGWRLEFTKSGDLNGDGRPDAVLVVRDDDEKKFIDTGRASSPKFDTNPRILVVALADAAGGYDLVLENHTLIARTTDPWQQDPLDPNGIQEGEIAIKNGTLRITLGYFAGDMGHITYTFRYQHKRLEMIGYDRVNVTRSSGVMSDLSINYSTRRAERKVGHISNDENKVTVKKLPNKPLLALPQIGDGLDFQPLPE